MDEFGTLCFFSCLLSSLEPKVLLVLQLSDVLHQSVSSSVCCLFTFSKKYISYVSLTKIIKVHVECHQLGERLYNVLR